MKTPSSAPSRVRSASSAVTNSAGARLAQGEVSGDIRFHRTGRPLLLMETSFPMLADRRDFCRAEADHRWPVVRRGAHCDSFAA